MKWVGKRTLKGGRLEIGRFWFVWRGWQRPIKYRIGDTTVVAIGPLAVFIGSKSTDQATP